jgi:hypothetical protein
MAMFDPLKFLKSKDRKEEITSLHLEAPKADVPASPAEGRSGPSPMAATPQEQMQAMQERMRNSPAQQEIQKRAMGMKNAGKHPESIFWLRDARTGGSLSLFQKEPAQKTIFLFSSAILAHFFVQEKKLPVEVVGCRFEELEASALEWRKVGFDSFLLDLSPKAQHFTVVKTNTELISGEQLAYTWCVTRSIRDLQAQARLAQFYGSGHLPVNPETLQKQRAVLETLRDCGSYDVPFVHWMIALIAGMQGDEQARQASTEVLERFGPDFVGRTVRPACKEELTGWGNSMGLAVVGLLAEYGILQGLDGKPVESIIRIETKPFEGGLPSC